MKKLLLMSLVALCLAIPTVTFAETTAVDEILTFSNGQVVNQDDGHAIIKFDVENVTSTYYTDLYYVPTLSIIESGSVASFVVPYYEYDATGFELAAKEKKTLTYDCKFPSILPSQRYAISITFYNKTYQLSGYQNNIFLKEVNGRGGFLEKNGISYLSCDGVMINSLLGVSFKGDEKVVATLPLKSIFSETQTVIPEISVYKRTKVFNGKPMLQQKSSPISFKTGEGKDIELSIPMFSIPDSYLVRIRMLDGSGNQISPQQDFRYVIYGESANIHAINAEKITSSETKIIADVTGPADASTLKDTKITLKIYDMAGNVISAKTETVDLSTEIVKVQTIAKNIGKDTSMKAEVIVEYNGKVLAKKEQSISLYKADENANQQFSDLIGTEYYDAVTFLNGLGILNGYPDGTFKPDNSITRAEFTVIAANLAKLELDSTAPSRFSDVIINHWAKAYINSSAKVGYLSGYPDGTFKPSNLVKYSESLTILLNILGYKNEVANLSYPWPLNYVSKSEEIGLHKNLGISEFSAEATRGKVALLVYNTYMLKK